MVAHSYGTIIAIEVMRQMQQLGYNNGKLILIDGSPSMMKEMTKMQLISDDDDYIQLTVLGGLMSQVIPLPDVLKHKVMYKIRYAFKLKYVFILQEELEKCKSYEERVWYLLDNSTVEVTHSKEYQAKLCISLYKRIKSVMKYENKEEKLDCDITLYKPSIATLADCAEDFNLSVICNHSVIVKECSGNHVTILENEQLSKEINKEFGFVDDDDDIVNGENVDTIKENSKEFAKVDVKHITEKSEAVKI